MGHLPVIGLLRRRLPTELEAPCGLLTGVGGRDVARADDKQDTARGDGGCATAGDCNCSASRESAAMQQARKPVARNSHDAVRSAFLEKNDGSDSPRSARSGRNPHLRCTMSAKESTECVRAAFTSSRESSSASSNPSAAFCARSLARSTAPTMRPTPTPRSFSSFFMTLGFEVGGEVRALVDGVALSPENGFMEPCPIGTARALAKRVWAWLGMASQAIR